MDVYFYWYNVKKKLKFTEGIDDESVTFTSSVKGAGINL